MTQFRPCIDLHQGKVKQIVGGTLDDAGATTNFISNRSADYYATLYRDNQLLGGHVIALGKGNDEQVRLALQTWPNGLQFGGGVNLENAAYYLEAGASHIIVTSYLFENNQLSSNRLEAIKSEVGKDRLVLDLSCRKTAEGWNIATNRWQTITETAITPSNLETLANYCDEFLIHAADVEGLQSGIDEDLVAFLGKHSPIATTYAGGARSLEDLKLAQQLSNNRVDLTIGSALDIFGGNSITLNDCIQWNKQAENRN